MRSGPVCGFREEDSVIRLKKEIVTMGCLYLKGEHQAIGLRTGVSESTVRYLLRRQAK